MRIRLAAIRLGAIGAIAIPLATVTLDAFTGSPALGLSAVYAAASIVFVAVGWLIVERRPGNVIGAIVFGFGLVFASYLPADAYLRHAAHGPAAEFAALYIGILDLPAWMLITLVILLFPDGRLPGPRWRWLLAADAVIVAVGLVGAGLMPGSFPNTPDYVNPLGVAGFPGEDLLSAAYLGMLVAVTLSAASIVGRWRRAGPAVRAQLKWVTAGAAAFAVTAILTVLSYQVAGGLVPLAALVSALGITLFQITVAIAILRYRLYDIDRVVSRTIGWALVTATVVAIYLVGILILQNALSSVTQGETLAVATSTLLAAAAFQPVRRRVQHAVDRRFHRARYDAEQIAMAFAERLRDQVDLESIAADLDAGVWKAVGPRTAGLWLRGPAQ